MGYWHKKPINNINDEKRPEPTYVNLGAIVCGRIKAIWLPDVPWKLAYREVARIFTVIKNNLRDSYDCKYDDEFVEALSEYSDEDLKLAYEPSKTYST